MAPQRPSATPDEPTKRPKITVLDLSARQIRELEIEVGIPVRRWTTGQTSDVDILVKVLAMVHGDGEDRYLDMSLRQLTELVQLDGGEDTDQDP